MRVEEAEDEDVSAGEAMLGMKIKTSPCFSTFLLEFCSASCK